MEQRSYPYSQGKNSAYYNGNNSRNQFKSNNKVINLVNIIYDNEFVAIINDLSSSLKNCFKLLNKLINNIKEISAALGNQIIYSKCLLNDYIIQNKKNKNEKLLQIKDRLDFIDNNKKLLESNISFMNVNIFGFIDNAKTLFKKMKTVRNSKLNNFRNNYNNIKRNYNSYDNKRNKNRKVDTFQSYNSLSCKKNKSFKNLSENLYINSSDDLKDYSKKVIYNKRINMSKKQHKTLEEKPILVNKLNFKENPFKEINPRMTKKEVNSNNLLKVQSIALDLELFENAYLSPVVHKQIVSALKMNFSTRLFSESTLDIISSGEAIAKLDQKFQDALLKLQIDFLRCECNDRPFCDCLQRGVSYYILNQRLNKKDPIDISKSLLKDYQIQAYPGDIFSWLDAYVRNLDAIKRVAQAYGKKDIVVEANKLIKIIETGK